MQSPLQLYSESQKLGPRALNSIARHTRSAKKRNMPGFDPQIATFHSIMRDLKLNPFRREGACFKAASLKNDGRLEDVLMIRPEGDLPYEKLPMELYTRIRDVLEHPGTYTWMLFSDGMIAAARALTKLELRSKHIDIFTALQKPVVAAGEMRVTAGSNVVEYNFNSGTFMEKIMRSTDGSAASYAKYHAYLERTFEAAGYSGRYSPGDLIREVVAQPDDLAEYAAIGYTVLGWPEEKEDMCLTYWGLKKYPETLQSAKDRFRGQIGREVTDKDIFDALLPDQKDYFGIQMLRSGGGSNTKSKTKTRRARRGPRRRIPK